MSASGLGPFRIGVAIESLPREVQRSLLPPPGGADSCAYYRRDGLAIRVIDGRIDRIEVTTPAYPTISGIRVGDSFAQLMAIYRNRITAYDHKYDFETGGKIFVIGPFTQDDAAVGVSILASPAKGVTELWCGNFDGLREAEGCS